MRPDLDRWFSNAAFAPVLTVTAAEIARRDLTPSAAGAAIRLRPTVSEAATRREAAKRDHGARRHRPPEQRRREKVIAAEAEAHIRAVLALADRPMPSREILASEHGTPREERRFSRVALEQRLATLVRQGKLVLGPRAGRGKSSEGGGTVATYGLPPA